jgi:hypothetical protein
VLGNSGSSGNSGNSGNSQAGTAMTPDALRAALRAHYFYMNASRLQQFSDVQTDRMGCISISGLIAVGRTTAGLYEIR